MKLIKNFFQKLVSRAPKWLDPKVVIILVVLSILTIAMTWSQPLPTADKAAGVAKIAYAAVMAQPTNSGRSPTPIPVEWAENRDLGSGLVFGAVVLVLIIVGGTLSAIRRR